MSEIVVNIPEKYPLVAKVSQHATHILEHQVPPNRLYHDLSHTQSVVDASLEIGQISGLDDDEMEVLLIAAWFHDTGFREQPAGHEEISKQIAEEYLRSVQYPADKIAQVKNAIEATKMPQNPKNRLEEVLCDADMSHLAKKGFLEKAESLRQEWDALGQKHYESDEDWYRQNESFILSHHYFTQYGKTVLEKKKQKNIRKLQEKLAALNLENTVQTKEKKHKKDEKGDKKEKKHQEEIPTYTTPAYTAEEREQILDKALMKELGIDKEEYKRLKKKLTKVDARPERGIETMFRITSKNHVDFSSMADSKSNIMISVNSIIISIIIGVLMRKLDANPHLIIPTIILLCVCLAAIVFAILATRPNITSGKFSKEDIEQKKANLLFFGNFHDMKLPDYEWGMTQLINDSDYLYGSMIRDIYFLGTVLGKKYRYLRYSYNIFMFGLIISSIAFIIATMFYGHLATNAVIAPGTDDLF